MSKEQQLEDWIKDKKEQLNNATVFINENGNEAVEVSLSVLNKFIEQAERVEELEKVVKHNFKHHKYQQEMIFNLEQQNKRYRDYLQQIKDYMIDDINLECDTSPHFIKDIIDEALESEPYD